MECILISFSCLLSINGKVNNNFDNRVEALGAVVYIQDKYGILPEISDNGDSFYEMTYKNKSFDVYFDGELYYDNFQSKEIIDGLKLSLEDNLCKDVYSIKVNFGKFYNWNQDDKYFGLVNKKYQDVNLSEVLNEGYNCARIILDSSDTSSLINYNITGLYGEGNVNYIFINARDKEELSSILDLDIDKLLIYIKDYAIVYNDVIECYSVHKKICDDVIYCFSKNDTLFGNCKVKRVDEDYILKNKLPTVSLYVEKSKSLSIGDNFDIGNYYVSIFSNSYKKFSVVSKEN